MYQKIFSIKRLFQLFQNSIGKMQNSSSTQFKKFNKLLTINWGGEKNPEGTDS
jgi:hypothetical protein